MKLPAFGNQKRRIRIGQWAEFFIKPEEVFFCAYYCAALIALLKLKVVSFGHSCSIEAGKVPLLREFYAGFCCAVFTAIAAEDAGIIAMCDFSYRRVGLRIIDLGERFGRTDVYAGTTANAGIEVKFRFASVPFRHNARLSRKTSGKSTARQGRRDCNEGLF